MKSREKPLRIGIIGGGPAGSTLACLLARAGIDAVLFDDGRRPEMVVGESLIPRLISVFQRLGIEDQVAALGTHKPGVTWIFGDDKVLELSFLSLKGVMPTYAYNVPRGPFDEVVHNTALKAGSRFIPCNVKLEVATTELGEKVPRLSAETLALVPDWKGQQPDLLVDASGRRRLFAKLLGLRANIGDRSDIAHFAHYENCTMPMPSGQTTITRLKHGWSWRIPLPNSLSVGVVFNKEYAKEYGPNAEAQLEAMIDQNKYLAAACSKRKRISPIATYANYQLISDQGHGDGWVCIGDAFGFVDPMLSPGLAMAMVSAEKVADIIISRSPGQWNRQFDEYLNWFRNMLVAWQKLVDSVYNGRIFALQRTGLDITKRLPAPIGNAMQRHFEKNFAGMAGGGLTNHPYSRRLLQFMSRYGIYGHDPKDYAIV